MKRSFNSLGGGCRIYVRGFDFGTTDQMIAGHMSNAGNVQNVERAGKGEAYVTYSSPDEAAVAMEQLQKTVINGNSRYIEILGESEGEQAIKAIKSGGGKGFGGGGFGMPMMNGGMQSDRRIYVRGFDFGTTDQQIAAHMSQAGNIEGVERAGKGEAYVTFSSPEEASMAFQNLNRTIISGNSRYIELLSEAEGQQAIQAIKSGGGKGQFGGDGGFQMPMMQQMPMMSSWQMQSGGMMSNGGWKGSMGGGAKGGFDGSMGGGGNGFNGGWMGGGSKGGKMSGKGGASPDSVQMIKQMQKLDPASKQMWWDYCDNYGEGNKDPARHSDEFIAEFMAFARKGGQGCGGGGGGMPSGKGGGGCMPCGGGGMPCGGGVQWSGDGNSGEDPPGSGRVLVRGFDYGTSDEQVLTHMSQVGDIFNGIRINQGSAHIVYTSKVSAHNAVSQLSQTIIPGNRRYIDVLNA